LVSRGSTNDTHLDSTSSTTEPFSRVALADLMWRCAGVHRSGAGLEAAAATLADWHTRSVASEPLSMTEREDANLLLLAQLTVAAASARDESRGAHHRADFALTRPDRAFSRAWRRAEPIAVDLTTTNLTAVALATVALTTAATWLLPTDSEPTTATGLSAFHSVPQAEEAFAC